jgi:enamine deaminase RidA (YjgF/YER057c/UK114 family)
MDSDFGAHASTVTPAQDDAAEPSPVPTETIERNGCRIALRRVDGPGASEIFVHCRPPADQADTGLQAEAIYRSIIDVLAAEGASFGDVVAENVFIDNLQANIGPVRDSRARVLAASGVVPDRPALTEIEQPPLLESARLAVSVQAVVSNDTPLKFESIRTQPVCGCEECAKAHGLRIEVGDETRFHAAGLCGPGDNAYEQTLGMFTLAEDLLHKAGMDFRDVVRTWIYLREMERDYGDLNQARRSFYEAREIHPVPASTGIGGGPVSPSHDLCLGIYAVKAPRPPIRTVMTSPTLNEAMEYGADFVRGLKVEETSKVAVHISGTASIDENGESAHLDDFDAQAERMLVNIAALLEGQGADFGDVVSAITYVKHPADTERLRAAFRKAGFKGFPNAMVAAPICRPELLCETEALAILPVAATESDSPKG